MGKVVHVLTLSCDSINASVCIKKMGGGVFGKTPLLGGRV